MPAPHAPVITGTTSNRLASAFKWEAASTGGAPTIYQVEFRVLKNQSTFDAVAAGTMPRPADNSDEWETWRGGGWPTTLPYMCIAEAVVGDEYEGNPPTPGVRMRIRARNPEGDSEWVYVPTNTPTRNPEEERLGMLGFGDEFGGSRTPVVDVQPGSLNGRGFRGYCFGGGGQSGLEIYVLSLFRGKDTNPRTGNIVRETIVFPNQSFNVPFTEEGVDVNFTLRVVGVNTVQQESIILSVGELEDGGAFVARATTYTIAPPVNLNTGATAQDVEDTQQISIELYSPEDSGQRQLVHQVNFDASSGEKSEDVRQVSIQTARLISDLNFEAGAGTLSTVNAGRRMSAALDFVSYAGAGLAAIYGVAATGAAAIGSALGLTGAAAAPTTAGGIAVDVAVSSSPFVAASVPTATGTISVATVSASSIFAGATTTTVTIGTGAQIALGAGALGGVGAVVEAARRLSQAEQVIQEFLAGDIRLIVVQADRNPGGLRGRLQELIGFSAAQQAGGQVFEDYVDRLNAWGVEQGIDPDTPFEEVQRQFDESEVRRVEAQLRLEAEIAQTQIDLAQTIASANAFLARREALSDALRAGTLNPLRRQSRRGEDPRSTSTSYTSGEFDDYVALVNMRIMNYQRPQFETDEPDAESPELGAIAAGTSLAVFVGDVIERYLDFTVNLTTGFRQIRDIPVIVRISVGRTEATPLWTELESAATYTLEVYPATGDLTETNRLQEITGITGTEQRVTGLVAQTEYRFRVRGVSSSGVNGGWSDIRSATTITPLPESITVRVSDITDTTADYRFTTVGDAVTYEIQRATNAGFSGAQTFTLTHPANTQQDTLLVGGTQYFVRGRAIGAGGTGPYGPVATFTTRPSVPETAPVFTISGITATTALVQWQRPPNATGVRIEWSENASFPSAQTTSAEPAGTNYTITGLTQNRLYHVRMRASNTSGSGPWSDTQSFTTIFVANAPNLRVALDGPGGRDPVNRLRRSVVGTVDNDANLQDTEMQWSLTQNFASVVGSERNRTFIGNVGDFFIAARNLLPNTTYYFRARRIRREFFIDGSIRGDRDTQIGPWSQPVSLHTPDLYDQPGQVFLSQLQRPPGFLLGAIEAEFDMPPEFQSFTNRAGTDVLTLRYQVAFTQDFSAPDLDILSSGANRNPGNRQMPYADGDELLRSYPIRPSNELADFIPDTLYYFRLSFLRELPRSGATPAQHSHGQWSSTLAIRTPSPAPLNPPRVLFENFTSAQVEFDEAAFRATNITYTLRWGQDGTEVGRSAELATADEYRISELGVAQSYWVDYRISFTDGNGVRRNTPWSPRANILTPLPAPPATAPDPLTITNVGFTQATANWGALPNISDYQLVVVTDRSGDVVVSQRVSGTTFPIQDLEPGGRYRARVRGFRYGVSGPWTREVGFETFRGFSEQQNVLPPLPAAVSSHFSRNRSVAILAQVNFGEVFGRGEPIIRRYSLAGHDVVFGGQTYRKTDQLVSVSGVGTQLGLEARRVNLTFANRGADIISFVQEPYRYRTAPTDIIYCLMNDDGTVERAHSYRFYNRGHRITEDTLVLDCVNFFQNLDTINGIRTSYNDQRVAIELGLYSEVDPITRRQLGTSIGEEDLAFQSSTIDFSAIQSGRVRKQDDPAVLTGGASTPDDGEDYTRQVAYGENYLTGNIVQAWNPSPRAVAELGYSWVPGPERSDPGTQWTTVVYAVGEGELSDLNLILFDMKANDLTIAGEASFTLQTSGEDGYYTFPLRKQRAVLLSNRDADGARQLPRAVAFIERSLGTNRGANFVDTSSLSTNNAEWTSQHRGAGTALVAITFKAWAGNGWPGGWPRIAFKTSGKLIPLLDGSFNSSPSVNPADVIYDYLTNRRYGCSVSPDAIDITGFEVARGEYLRRSGSGFYRAFLRGVVDSGKAIGKNLTDMLDACQSELFLNEAGLITLLPKRTISLAERNRAYGENHFDADRRGDLIETTSSPPSSRYNRARVVANVVNRALGDRHDYEAVSRAAFEEDFFVRNEVEIKNPFLSVRRTRRNEIDNNDRSHLRAMATHAIVSSRKFRNGRFLVPDGLWGRHSGLRVGNIITVGSNRRGWVGDRSLLARIVRLDVINGGDYILHYHEYSDDIYNVGGPLIEPVSPVFRGPSFGGLQAEPGETLDRLGFVPVATFLFPEDGLLNIRNEVGLRFNPIGADQETFTLGEYDFGTEAGVYSLALNPSWGIDANFNSLQFAPAIGSADSPEVLTNVAGGMAFRNPLRAAQFEVPRFTRRVSVGVILRKPQLPAYNVTEGTTFTLFKQRSLL